MTDSEAHASGSSGDSSSSPVGISASQDGDQIKESLREAEELKQEGNDAFRSSNWNEALVAYRSALGKLPERRSPGKGKASADTAVDDDADNWDEHDDKKDSDGDGSKEAPVALSGIELQCSKARAVLNANIGACLVKLGDHKDAVQACTEALRDDPKYIKALQRRAASNEKIDTWSSLSSAQEDYNALLQLLPLSSPQTVDVKRSLELLKPRAEAAQKRETSEMLSKLKGLGDNILGNFGLSTDNFKFEPNGQGGYSMNFVR